MATVKMSGKLTLSKSATKELTAVVMQEWVKRINLTLQGRLGGMLERIKQAVGVALSTCQEFNAIRDGGVAHGEVGLTDADARIAAIVNMLADSIQITLRPFTFNNGRIAGSVVIYGMPVDCREVIESAEGTLISENGKAWQWLYAMLFQQGQIIIADYRYLSDVLDEQAKEVYSRTKQGFMVKSDKGFRLPPEIAGTIDDNLITRVCSSSEIRQLLQTELEHLLT